MNRTLHCILCLLLFALPAQAQFEIKGGSTNLLDSRRAGASATVSGGQVNAITVRARGGGYASPPLVTLSSPSSGTTATANAIVSGGQVTGFTITQVGSGYTTPPAVTIAAPVTPTGPPVTTPQYAGVASTTATGGAISTNGIETTPVGRYPVAKDTSVPAAPVITTVLERASFGYTFASGTPLYLLGDEIQRPVVSWSGATVAQSYWRTMPVQPGETFSPHGTSNLGALPDPAYPLESVTVVSSNVDEKTVTVSSPPASLISGSRLLGSLVGSVSGTTVILLNNANQTITSATSRPLTPYQPYYYSIHADKVFATQPGRVTITWVSAVPDTSLPGESTPSYKFRRETFAVSSGTKNPVRTIFWTEKGFDSQAVSIPSGRIVRVNPVYNTFLPSTVAEEYAPVGSNPGTGGTGTLPPETRTVWFDNQLGPPSLHAYNAEGRIFIEYLGAEKQGVSGVHQFLGADILEVKRVAESRTIVTDLGAELQPRGAPEDGDESLVPNIVLNFVVGQKSPYGTHQRPDGVTRYFAERESLDPDKVTLYWLEPKDAAIHFLPEPNVPGLTIQWPKLKRNYIFAWPDALARFEPVNVLETGAAVETALQFEAVGLPQIIFQDDPAETEAEIDPSTQRLLVDLTASTDKTNRSLLKFTSANGPWYVRLFIQSEGLLGSPAVAEIPDPDGAGPLTGTPGKAAVYALNDRDADGVADFTLTASVGQRLEPPGPGYEPGGYISEGLCYSAAAYIDPFAAGVPAAGMGGIIPVNARPNDKFLTVWWFRKIEPPTDKFRPFYVPAAAARYEVGFPANPQELVIASGKGLENPSLTAEQSGGEIYAVNEEFIDGVPQAGYNPNEEHAALLGDIKNAYALRDDLNTAVATRSINANGTATVTLLSGNTTGLTAGMNVGIPGSNTVATITSVPNGSQVVLSQTVATDGVYSFYTGAYTSEPFVLIAYTDASGRPAMRVAKVVRETVAYPLSYNQAAGIPVQPPLPLTLLPLPLKPDGHVRNQEVGAVDDATGAYAPGEYNSFTFEDRTGRHWLYRGPHVASANPGFGMKYYYYSLPTFYVPGLTAEQQPPVGTIMPFIASVDSDKTNSAADSLTIPIFPKWPDDPVFGAQAAVLGLLDKAETLTLQKAGLPQIRGQSSVQVLYQQSIANSPANGGTEVASVILHDPTRAKSFDIGLPGRLPKIPASVATTNYAGRTYFQKLPPHLQSRFFFDSKRGVKGALVLEGEFFDEIAGEDYLNLNALGTADVDELKALCPVTDTANKGPWDAAIAGLSTTLVTYSDAADVAGSTAPDGVFVPDPAKDSRPIPLADLADIRDPDTARDSYALSSTGGGSGYVTLIFNNGQNPAQTDPGEPVDVKIIKVSDTLYRGDLKVLLSSNPLDEQVTLRHSGDYGAKPENFEFVWRYAFPDNGNPPTVPAGAAASAGADINTTASTSTWLKPNGTWANTILVGGSPTASISTPAVIMSDTYFTMAYRRIGDPAWSEWMPPKQVEGWIKRVLAKITPFNQRMTDLYNNDVNTDVSLLTQAGSRWEGDIALNLNNINDAGLIEIYETVLNRGKSFTIGSGIDFSGSNNALLLAAGYLHDLYTILGNEAYADAANPTISIDDQTTVTEVNTSRFSFESQVKSSLDEELALLRGRDNFSTAPGTGIAPAYNRLYWNYTRGIDSGEVLYAVNYNIQEKTGSETADGVVDAADAQRMFPQGHGDAYGHYLTALTGYYKLLTHPDFTWVPQAEAVTVLGQSVLIDYQDERKFAGAAANLARTAQQILALVTRQSYSDDAAAGWQHLRDSKTKPTQPDAGETRDWGVDEWASRSAQGNFFHWVVGNAMLPDEDTVHAGVQKIDRTADNVPELSELVSAAESFQTTMDNANTHLNPLGLSPGAIAFDISPAEMRNGNSHYEQVHTRALRAVLNAKGSFDQAAKMTRLLRNQENQIANQNDAIVDQMNAYNDQMVEIYGTPYAGDIGPGATYEQGYEGPDTENWFVIDRPSDLVDTSTPVSVSLRVPTGIRSYTGGDIAEIVASFNGADTVSKRFTIDPNRFSQFATVMDPSGGLGRRGQTGALQQALLDAWVAQVALLEANSELQVLHRNLQRETDIFSALVSSHQKQLSEQGQSKVAIAATEAAAAVLAALGEGLIWSGEAVRDAGTAAAEAAPTTLIAGFSNGGDFTSAVRAGLKIAGGTAGSALVFSGVASNAASGLLQATVTGMGLDLELQLMKLGFSQDELQAAYEYELSFREIMAQHYHFADLAANYQAANQEVVNLLALGDSLQSERESFRQRAAAVINGYRTRDLTFRTFRNEALEQYRTLFDLASRYTYLSAKSYDYETGLLGTPQGRKVIADIVASRSLGDLTGDIPQATTSTLGDSGLAGTMAQLQADFSVAKGRLGINNPDPAGTLFSFRRELFRITDDPASTADDDLWQQRLEQAIQPDLMSDPDVAKYCNNLRKPNGTPVPGILLEFSSTIHQSDNFFGLPGAPGDHGYSPSSYSTKISSVGLVLPGYVGMDPYAVGTPGAGGPDSTSPDALRATPYVYFIPCGNDYMLAPPLGDTNTLRSWTVHDQALPLPYNLGASAFNTTEFFSANGTLSEQPWILRKHQAFRPVNDPAFFFSTIPAEFTNSRLIGRSVWNSKWKIVIPAYTLLSNEQDGLNRFVRSVKDVQLFLRTYSYSGN